MNPTSVANQLLKHTNPQFYIGKTEVRSRFLWPVGVLLGTKMHPVGPFLAQNIAANRSILATERPKLSPRLQSNPHVAQSNPQVDT